MPRSRSRSMVSSTCSRISRLSRVPVSSISRSARVDLPWSMWATMQKLRMWSWRMWGRNIGAIFTSPRIPLPPVTGWFDPTSHGGALRLAAHSYLPAKGDLSVRLPGLRRGDLVTLEDGRVVRVNDASPPPAGLADRPEFADLGAVHPSRPLLLESP